MWTSTDSSNLATLVSLTSAIASAGVYSCSRSTLPRDWRYFLPCFAMAQATSTPMERAVPAMIFIAWSTSWALRSCSFFSAIARSWSWLMRPTFSRCGSPEPFSMPMAWRMSTAAGGVLVMKVKERSSKTVISTGIVVPMSPAVWALKALTNSMMLMPCWPSAGPTGGAGEACPPGACSLMVVRTFFMSHLRGHPAHESERRGRGSDSYLLDLVVAHLDGRLAAKDRYQHLQLARVLVDLGDLAREVRQGAGDDLDRLADVELRAARGPHRDLAVQQTVDLGLRQRDRLVGRADEAGDARRALDHLPRVLVEVHVDQHVAGHRALLDRDLLVVLHLLDGLGRHDDLAHGTGLTERGDAVLEVLLDLVLVPGVGVDDVPAKHGFLDLRELEDGVDERLPQRIEQAEVAPGDDDEAEHDRGRLTDLPAVGALHAAELVDAVPQEGEDAPALPAPDLGPGGVLAVGGAGRDEVRLRLVGRALGVLVVVELVLVDARLEVVLVADLGRDRTRLGEQRLVDVGRGVLQRAGHGRALPHAGFVGGGV